MIDLEALKAIAIKAANPEQHWNANMESASTNARSAAIIMDRNLTTWNEYQNAFSPEVALKLIERIETMRLSLTALVNLKDHKDRCGKDEFYERHQPGVWSMAREALKACEGESK